MSISTKRGDTGETSLCSGERVPKSCLRVEAYGDIDELQAQIGVCRASAEGEELRSLLYSIEVELMYVMGDVALANGDHVFSTDDIEKAIASYEEELPAMTSFEIPGNGTTEAALHLARTICRRAERKLWALEADSKEPALRPEILRWMNRLSDLLFILARRAAA